MSLHKTQAQHKAFYAEFVDLIDRHTVGMSPAEMLAIVSNVVGKMVALQDQRKMTPAEAMEIVAKNIETGNAEALRGLTQTAGTA